MFIAASESRVSRAQFGDWQTICVCAVSKLEEICKRICSGDIFVYELQTISDKKTLMSKLCAAACPMEHKDGNEDQDKPSSAISFAIPSYGVLTACLDLRLKEFNYFTTYNAQLSHFLQLTSSLVLTGMSVHVNIYVEYVLKILQIF